MDNLHLKEKLLRDIRYLPSKRNDDSELGQLFRWAIWVKEVSMTEVESQVKSRSNIYMAMRFGASRKMAFDVIGWIMGQFPSATVAEADIWELAERQCKDYQCSDAWVQIRTALAQSALLELEANK